MSAPLNQDGDVKDEERGGVEALARVLHGPDPTSGGPNENCGCVAEAKFVLAKIAAAPPAERLAIAGITEDRLAAAIDRWDETILRAGGTPYHGTPANLLAALERTP